VTFLSAIFKVFFAIFFFIEDFTAKFRQKIAPRRKKNSYKISETSEKKVAVTKPTIRMWCTFPSFH
jgi:hypothetical protein